MALSSTRFRKLCLEKASYLQSFAPYDTGNLVNNAIKVEFPSENVCRIYVDTIIAPYMPYTEYPWISPKWNGKKNPNEGWFKQAAHNIYRMLITDLNGSGSVDKTALEREFIEWREEMYVRKGYSYGED